MNTVRLAFLLAFLSFQVMPPSSSMPGAGVLAPCPDSPNCVSSEAVREAQRVPTVSFSDSPTAALARAKAALLAEPRSTVTSDSGGHLRGQCRSLVFRFVDDVDIVVDAAAGVFRFRSASRVGRSDLGVNRKRVARIAARLRQASP